MKFNLILNYYNEKSAERKPEIDFCLNRNIANPGLDEIYVFVAPEDVEELNKIDTKGRTKKIVCEQRPSYNNYFEITRLHPHYLNAFCNSDIFFEDSTIHDLKNYKWKNDLCFALSRWELTEAPENAASTFTSVLFDREDSQDAWIFKGGVPNIKGADFTPGIAGCDNAIAFLIKNAGYAVWNPAKSMKTLHFHLTNIRSYVIGRPEVKILPPYLWIKTCRIEDVVFRSGINRFVNFRFRQFLMRMNGKLSWEDKKLSIG